MKRVKRQLYRKILTIHRYLTEDSDLEYIKNCNKSTRRPIARQEKNGPSLECTFTKDASVANKHMKRLLDIREMQLKQVPRHAR